MTVAAYKVWQEVKAWEEEQAEKRRAEEEDEDSEEGEEEVMMLKERRPKGGRKGEGGVTGEITEDQKIVERGTPGDVEVRGKVEKTENGEKSEVQENERKVQVGDSRVKVEKTKNGEKSEVQENEWKVQV
jgi:hypothetical protein